MIVEGASRGSEIVHFRPASQLSSCDGGHHYYYPFELRSGPLISNEPWLAPIAFDL